MFDTKNLHNSWKAASSCRKWPERWRDRGEIYLCVCSFKWLNSLGKTSEVQQFGEHSSAPSKGKHSSGIAWNGQESQMIRIGIPIWIRNRIHTQIPP